MIERKWLKILLQRIENESNRFIEVLYGPRQVGKTTLVKQLLESSKLPSHYASGDAITPGRGAWIAQQWEAARLKCQSSPEGKAILVLDEIQKISNWSEQVKAEWDADRWNKLELKVILLGSSRLLLQQGLTESLTGRFEALYLPHWSYAEMQALCGLSIEEYVWYGGYPGSAGLFHDEDRWKSYMLTSIMETSISRDILMLTRVDKPALIRQLFETGCSYSGQILSLTKVLGQMQDAGNTTTLSHYLRLLDQAGLLTGLYKYSPKIIRQRASHPKFQVHNTAFMSALSPQSFSDIRHDPVRWGRWVESAIGAHLVNQCLEKGCSLYYWRHRNDEVDFVIERKGTVTGIEVKTTGTATTSGMDVFRSQFHPDSVLLVGRSGIPVEEFLNMEI